MGRRLGAVGWIALALSAAQAALALSARLGAITFPKTLTGWLVPSAVVLALLGLVLVQWLRFWIRESHEVITEGQDFELISEAMLDRFRTYRLRVARARERAERDSAAASAHEEERRRPVTRPSSSRTSAGDSGRSCRTGRRTGPACCMRDRWTRTSSAGSAAPSPGWGRETAIPPRRRRRLRR